MEYITNLKKDTEISSFFQIKSLVQNHLIFYQCTLFDISTEVFFKKFVGENNEILFNQKCVLKKVKIAIVF